MIVKILTLCVGVLLGFSVAELNNCDEDDFGDLFVIITGLMIVCLMLWSYI